MTWTTVRLGHLVDEHRDTVDVKELGVDEVIHMSIPNFDEFGEGRREAVADIGSGKTLLRGGELLISKLNPRKQRIVQVRAGNSHTVPIVCSGEFVVLLPRQTVDGRFLDYALRAETTRSRLAGAVLSVTRSQQRVRPEEIKKLPIVLPPLEHQRRIVGFLDAETERIDQLIAAKARMITHVEERHSAEVEAQVCYASSRYPQASVRRLVISITQGTSSQAGSRPAEEQEWGILKLSAVKNGRFLPSENKVLDGDSAIDETLQPNVGDLLVTRSNTPAYVGDVCSVEAEPGKVLLPDLIYRLVVDDGADARFLSAALRTARSRRHLSSAARGTSQSMVKLRGEDILDCVVPAPPPAEQRAIADSLGESRRRADELIAALRDQITLLGERRRSLITAAVIGEMEVP